jgi:gliding motility-associated-like protein/uncharacterized repeat protein (TIGR01451 family)
MKKYLPFSYYKKEIKNRYFIVLFLLVSSITLAQTITPTVTPTKIVTVKPGVCGIIDVELKIQGANPIKRPLEVVLVIDVSGSMDDDIQNDQKIPLDYAKDAAVGFINTVFTAANNPLGSNRIAIVTYSTNATTVRPLTLSSGQADLINAINGLVANGSTNIEAGIAKADEVLNLGTFDCKTSRSIVLLTDGVANRNIASGDNCTGGQGGTCIQSAITAATAAKTGPGASTSYSNQIFSVGLFGAISGSEQTDAEYALNNIQSGGSFFAENAADLTPIYDLISTQLSHIASQLVAVETIGTDFTLNTDPSTITTGGIGSTTISGGGTILTWNVPFLNPGEIILKYQLSPKSGVCGNKSSGSSTLNYTNSSCLADSSPVTTPTTTVPCPIVTIASQTNINCFGQSTGVISINDATGGVAPYTYDWADVAGISNDKDRTGLAGGTYTLNVKDANGCSAAALVVTLSTPTTPITVVKTSQTNVLCHEALTGAINITASGGTGAYTYDWADITGTNNDEDRSGLAAGTYTVIVRDANGCSSASLSVTILEPATAVTVVKTSQTNILCFNDETGAINITASGGTGAYTYDWADIPGTSNSEDRSGLAAGTYTVIVRDANGCSTAALSVTILEPATAVTVVKTSQTNILCFNDETGAINITASGGTGAYTYDWADILGTNNSEDRTGLTEGTYTVTVTDVNGCSSAPLSITISEPATAVTVVKTSQTDVSCFDGQTGAINITASGGTGAYSYDWADIPGTNNSEDRTGLAVGNYTVTVIDANGCSTSPLSVTITEPAVALSVVKTSQTDVLCFNDNTGEINITAADGTGTYTYDWDDIAGTDNIEDRTGLIAGTYSVIVKDANGCATAQLSITITQPAAAISATGITVNNNNCVGCSNGSIDLTVDGGESPYTFLWSNGATTEDLSDLAKGSYSVEIKDKNGCTANYTFEITESGMSLTKDGMYIDTNNDGKTNIGDNVSYNFVVTNTGNVPLTNVMITDINAVVSGGPIATLEAGASDSTTFTAIHAITQEEINTGYVYNLATATATDSEDKPVSATSTDATPCDLCPRNTDCPDCTITPLDQDPKITLVKTGAFSDTNNDGFAQAGEKINYTFTVSNIGNVTLTNVIITDPLVGLTITGNPIASLAPGATNSTITGVYTIIQSDVDAGKVTNSALATAQDPNGADVTDTSGTTVDNNTPTETPLPQKPSIALVKTSIFSDTNNDGFAQAGEKINYTFTVTNTGNVVVNNITITDPLVGLVLTGNPIVSLAPGATNNSITGVYIIIQSDIDAGKVTNSALAIGKDSKGNEVTDTSGTTVDNDTPTETPLNQSSGMVVTKTANTTFYSAVGDIINYTIQVKNTGNITLHQIVVTDPLTGLNSTIETLTPGNTKEFTQNYTVTQSDRENGSVTNVASATGLTPNDTQITASDEAVVEANLVLGCGSVTVHNAFSPNGDGINETFVIDNIDDVLCYPENTVEIYNRWGILVFETKNYNNSTNAFDGTSHGRTTISQSSGLPTGTYYYILYYTSIDGNGGVQTNKKDGYLYLSK